ncbi:MAG: tRNA pseudouridine(38-40) synthase TruA [FCB group bacterium]
METLILKIEYDGTNYAGWQIQPNAVTIQEEIEKALFKICGYRINLIAAGRTDAGVHARGQVAHGIIPEEQKIKFSIPDYKISHALNSNLPDDIRIISGRIVPTTFHARYDAIAREYSYSIHTANSVFLRRFSTLIKYKLDYELLKKSSEIFIGIHDFTTFSKNNEEIKNHKCNVEVCKWEQIDENRWFLKIRANRFLYGMVRALVGAMIDIAREKRTIKEIEEALKLCNRELASSFAQPQGLVLEEIFYPENFTI